MDCLFCKMATRQLVADFVYESNQCFVIRDIHPKAKVHLLAIPKAHVVTLNDISEENANIVSAIGLAIAAVTKQSNIAETGYRVIVNNGEHGGQEVKHLHFHILGGEPLGKMIC